MDLTERFPETQSHRPIFMPMESQVIVNANHRQPHTCQGARMEVGSRLAFTETIFDERATQLQNKSVLEVANLLATIIKSCESVHEDGEFTI